MATVPSPRTWAVADLETAALFNAGLRDPLNFLLSPPRAQAIQAVAQTIPTSAETAITLDTGTGIGTVNNDGMWVTGANTKLTAVTPGKYLISAAIGFAANATGRRQAAIRLNGTTFLTQTEASVVTAASAVTNCPIPSFEYQLNVGDYLELLAFQTSGAGLLTSVAYPLMSFMRAQWEGI